MAVNVPESLEYAWAVGCCAGAAANSLLIELLHKKGQI